MIYPAFFQATICEYTELLDTLLYIKFHEERSERMRNFKTAIIDIGSNTIRLVLYEYEKRQGLYEFGNFKTVARLRTYLLPDGSMSKEGINVLKDTLTSFKEILDDYGVTDVKAAATAAIRQATNQTEIVEEMFNTTGIRLDILSEEEEAYFGFLAVSHSMDTPSAITVDIGGGSTEITYYENKKLQKTHSFPFGTVSLKQKFVKGPVITPNELSKLTEYVKKQFETLDWIQGKKLPIVAIGGSARNVAQIHQQKNDYPISSVHQYEIRLNEMKELKYDLSLMNYDQLKQLDGLSSDRADIIVPALQVFITLMEVVGANIFQISKKGLREGLILSRVLQGDAKAFNKYDVFEESARRIAWEYERSEEETKALENLADQFYLQCCDLGYFTYNEQKCKLFKYAARLYAIGEYIELDSSSQHTFYLLANQTIYGMNHVNRLKLALMASYKNKDYFRRFLIPFKDWISREEQAELRDLGAVLKFIHALNISKRNIVHELVLINQPGAITVEVYTKQSAVAEIYYAERQKKHIERVFKKPVTILFVEKGA